MPEPIWVARLEISSRTVDKLSRAHGLSAADVRDALVCVAGLRATWDDHPDRGRRALIEFFLNGQRVLAVLYPVQDALGDTWNLGSAYRVR